MNTHTLPLAGQLALVTGGSRGIGRAIACRFAADGATVVITYKEQAEQGAEVVGLIEAAGGTAAALALDVRDEAGVKAVVKDIGARFGPVSILVNNAGIVRDNYLRFLSTADWDEVLKTNLDGAFFCTKAVLAGMQRLKWGRIINISSDAALLGDVRRTNYAAAKAGLLGFTYALAREVAGQGITVNAICPGIIDTALLAEMEDSRREGLLRNIPVGRFGAPEDVAALATFLAHPQAAYLTGQAISVDGGLHMG